MLLRLLFVFSVLLMTGCAIVPDSIKVQEEQTLVSYSKAVTGGSAVEGQPARWGGLITSVENKPGKTFIEVVHFPLNHYGKPVTSEETIGRFKAVINNFVDPIVFEEGRSVTFLGSVGGMLSGMVGEQPYQYPTITVDDYHLWRQESVHDMSGVYLGFYNGWYSPFFYPFYRPWGFYPNRVRVIHRTNGPSSSKQVTPVYRQPTRNVPTQRQAPSRRTNETREK